MRQAHAETTSGALGRPNRVEGAKRLRRSRWDGPRLRRSAREDIEESLPVLMENRGTLMRNTKPFGSRPGEKGTRTKTGRPDRRRAGRSSSFNPEEPPCVLPGSGPTDLHFGKNGIVLSGFERTGPPDGCPARHGVSCDTGGPAPGPGSAVRTERRDEAGIRPGRHLRGTCRG